MLTEKIYTYEEYLARTDNLEKSYELIAGKLREMPPESHLNVQIAFKLILIFIKSFGVARVSNKAEIIISGSRVTARIPDVTVFSEEGVKEAMERNTSTIDIDMLPPLLVVEVVSPGKEAKDRDYRYKRSEYAARGIKYYWIVDPQEEKITSLELVDGYYTENVITKQEIASITHPEIADAIELDYLF